MKMLYAVLLVLFATSAMSQTAIPIPNDAQLVYQGECIEDESGERGFCQVGETPNGTIYLIFYQEGEPVFVRRVHPGQPYETIWQARPLGQSL